MRDILNSFLEDANIYLFEETAQDEIGRTYDLSPAYAFILLSQHQGLLSSERSYAVTRFPETEPSQRMLTNLILQR